LAARRRNEPFQIFIVQDIYIAPGDLRKFYFFRREGLHIALREVFQEIPQCDYVITLRDFLDIAAGQVNAESPHDLFRDFFGRRDFCDYKERLEIPLIVLACFLGAVLFYLEVVEVILKEGFQACHFIIVAPKYCATGGMLDIKKQPR